MTRCASAAAATRGAVIVTPTTRAITPIKPPGTARAAATAPPIGGPVNHHQFRSAVSSRPVIQSYDSQKATIVEVPSEGEDVTVVMVFDDSLPADL